MMFRSFVNKNAKEQFFFVPTRWQRLRLKLAKLTYRLSRAIGRVGPQPEYVPMMTPDGRILWIEEEATRLPK